MKSEKKIRFTSLLIDFSLKKETNDKKKLNLINQFQAQKFSVKKHKLGF